LVASLSISSAALVVAFQTPDTEALRAAEAPPNAVFVDTLDMAPVAATVIRRGGRGVVPPIRGSVEDAVRALLRTPPPPAGDLSTRKKTVKKPSKRKPA